MEVKPDRDAGQDGPMSNVPGFLTKLWLLVEDEATDGLIRWGPLGNSFIVQNQTRFAKEVLPMFFKHNNLASFVRQLNMYGFRKRAHPEHGSLLGDHDDIEFQHPNFQRGKRNLLENIKRKISSREDPKVKMEDMHQILTNVQEMKGKQESITGTLQEIQRENEVLWREVVFLRQRHEKQQKIVNRLIQFLLTMVKPVGLKRKQQLMLEPPSDQTKPKSPKFASTSDNLQPIQTTPYDVDLDTMPHISVASPAVSDVSDVTHTADSTQPLTTPCEEIPNPLSSQSVLDPTQDTLDPSLFELDIPAVASDTASPIITSPANVESPSAPLTPPSASVAPSMFADGGWSLPESGVDSNDDLHNVLTRDSGGGQLGAGLQVVYPGMQTVNSSSVPTSRAVIKRSMSHEEKKGEIGEHVNSVQENLEVIQNLLSSFNSPSTYSLDMDSLLDIFSSDEADNSNETDPFSVLGNSQNGTEEKSDVQENIKGNEVVQYVGPSGTPFTVEDEDSLLRSLNIDAAALARTCEGFAPSASVLKKQ